MKLEDMTLKQVKELCENAESCVSCTYNEQCAIILGTITPADWDIECEVQDES